jgi:predicted nucleotidyltransferase
MTGLGVDLLGGAVIDFAHKNNRQDGVEIMYVSKDWDEKSKLTDFVNLLSSELVAAAKFVLLVGSYSEGLETSTSDVDIYVCTTNGYSGTLHNAEEMRRQPHRRVEVSVVDVGFFEKNLKKANSNNYDGFLIREVEILHKLLKGTVLAGAAEYEAMTRSVSKDAFDDKVIKYFHDFSLNHYDDLVGAHQDNDGASAALFARFLVDSAVDAALAASGDTYPKLKWRLKRASRTLSSELYNEYLWLTFNAALASADNYSTHCRRALSLYKELTFGVWFASNFCSTESCQVTDENVEYFSDPWVFPYIAHGVRLIKYQGKIFHVGLLAHLIVSFSFRPRTWRTMVDMGQLKGFSTDEVNAALANLLSIGLLVQVSA